MFFASRKEMRMELPRMRYVNIYMPLYVIHIFRTLDVEVDMLIMS